MPPCLDAYVWLPDRAPEALGRFIDSYVNVDDPGDERLHAFTRTHVLGIANDTDDVLSFANDTDHVLSFANDTDDVLGIANDTEDKVLGESRLSGGSDGSGGDDAFTLYLRAHAPHYQAIITFTRDGATVLGLSVDAPDDLPEALSQAERLVERLRRQFTAPAGRAGVELPPAGDRTEWHEEAQVLFRIGELPGEDLSRRRSDTGPRRGRRRGRPW
ncbi:hypothetical protein [Nonomuraea sp. NPDC050691]|uniref:hypothetical protein n=1 Tax=Nonomuraea sp. NPDC050691 TaxID=3155661 RepID=UPI00340DC1E2